MHTLPHPLEQHFWPVGHELSEEQAFIKTQGPIPLFNKVLT